MNNYLAIIRKLDFIDLFKYGHFRIDYAVPFDGNVLSYADDDDFFNSLTYRMNMYEYSFEYVIIHFRACDYNGQCISIDIKDVCGVYTFDLEAKKEMSISFDPRIQLHVSPWTSKFDKFHQKLSIEQSLRGVDNLWEIFNLDKSELVKCEQIINSECVQEVFRELYAYERPIGNLSIWTYLLRYERHSFYPKDMVGFFCDFIHVYCNFSKGMELSGEIAETTQLYSQLIACNNPNLRDLYEIVKTSPLSEMTEQVSGCRFALAAPLFLYLKSSFIDGMEHKPSDRIISYAKEIGGFECSIAVYLLGIALGYDKTYDAFYESANLQFFKKMNAVEKSIYTEIPNKMASNQHPVETEASSNESEVSEEKVNSVMSSTEAGSNESEVSEEKVELVMSSTEAGSNKYKVSEEKVNSVMSSTEASRNESKVSEEKVEPITSVTEDISKKKSLIVDETKDDTYNFGKLPHEMDPSIQGTKMPILWMRTNPKKKKIDARPVFNEEDFTKLTKQGYEPVKAYTKLVTDIIASFGYNPEIEKKRCKIKK